MPELPEIETIKLQLQKVLVGQTILRLEKLHPKSVIGDTRQVKGRKVNEIDRKGKMLIIGLSEDLHLAIHFKMSGQLILVTRDKEQETGRIAGGPARNASIRVAGGHPTGDWTGTLPSLHTRAIFYFKSGDVLFFNDQRIFGWIKIVRSWQLAEDSFIKNLGPEPWDITDRQFYNRIHHRKRAIKVLIMDQHVLSGVGNIYANDAIWEARIHPETTAQSLAFPKAKLLRAGLIKVLKEGIKYGGATSSDEKYVDLKGMGGTYQEHFRTYRQTGKPCLRGDGGIIKKITLGGRGTYFCPVCQH